MENTRTGGAVSDSNHELLLDYAATNRFRSGRPTQIQIAGDTGILFLRSGPRDTVQNLYEHDLSTGDERCLLAVDQLIDESDESVGALELARRERMRLAATGITSFETTSDYRMVLATIGDRVFLFDRSSGQLTELTQEDGAPLDARFSPDGRSIACVRNGDLYVIDTQSHTQRRLTSTASDAICNGLSEFVAQEEMHRMHGYWWSPDSQWILYQETDESDVETLYIADPFDPGRRPQPWRYPRAGTTNARVRLGLISTDGGPTTWISWDQQRYPYLASVGWSENAPLTILVQNREQTEEVLLSVDRESGATRLLLTEQDPVWLNLDQDFPRWLPDGSGFLWMTERNGQRQLELRSADGTSIRALTGTDVEFRKLVHVEKDAATAWILAATTPIRSFLAAVSIDSGQMIAPDQAEPVSVSQAIVSSETDHVVRTVVPADGQPRWDVCRRQDGEIVQILTELKSVGEVPRVRLNREFTVVGDTLLYHGSIVRPSGFEPNRKYPVLVFVYGGPGSQVVTEARLSYPLDQWFAEQGFVVVSIDGRGTPGRGRDWERSIRGNFVEKPLEDQVAGLRLLGEQYPEMDLNRVGIFGWSFGGYMSAMAVMQRPDVFHAGVCAAPVGDFRDYDTHYTERYLGLPGENPEAYDASSLLTYANQLSRPLLLVHGTSDDNCYFSGMLRFSDSLFRAGKLHEFLPLAGQTHMVKEPAVVSRLYERTLEFFLRHLGDG